MEARQAKISVALAVLALGLWAVLYNEAITSAVRIWYVSEIFSHGFFIVPGALYLIWRERKALEGKVSRPSYLVLPFLVCFVVLGVFGEVGDIQVFAHIAAFTVLPLSIWFLVGNQIAKVLWFPLCFMLFAIPIGEQLVPHLQQITADLAIIVLNWTTIPSYNTGLYIEIPQGKFVVAEACSGIRFFVGSLVFGAVYSHLSYRSFPRKVAFMLLALTVPVIANALRVFGIVVIGYYSDMEYASGADHLVYGWVFFCIVLFLLVVVGETFRERGVVPTDQASGAPEGDDASSSIKDVQHALVGSLSTLSISPLIQLLVILSVAIVWQNYVQVSTPVKSTSLDTELLAEEIGNTQSFYNNWSPVFVGESARYRTQTILSSEERGLVGAGSLDWVLVWYASDGEGSELVASANSMFDKESWSKDSERSIFVEVELNGTLTTIDAKLLDIVSSKGEKRLILYWYQLADQTLSSRIKTKLLQSLDLMLGNAGDGAMITVSIPYRQGYQEQAQQILIERVKRHYQGVSDAIPY